MSNSTTNRRNVLKMSAIVAAPVAALVPATVAMAADGSASRLTLLEDQRAIEQLTRSFVKRFNAHDLAQCGEFLTSPEAVSLCEGLDQITQSPDEEPQITMANDGISAHYQQTCKIAITEQFAGSSTIEQMARFQGQSSAHSNETRILKAQLSKTDNQWTITQLELT